MLSKVFHEEILNWPKAFYTDQEKMKSGIEKFWDPTYNRNSALVLFSILTLSGTTSHIVG